DYLLLIFAGVLPHPDTLPRVAQYVDERVVGDDPACVALWKYLQATGPLATRYEALAELAAADVPDAMAVMERLVDAAAESTPKRTVGVARALARTMINVRRREHVKRETETTPVAALDVEAIATEAAKRYPHTSTLIRPLSVEDAEAAVDESYTVIPTGF